MERRNKLPGGTWPADHFLWLAGEAVLVEVDLVPPTDFNVGLRADKALAANRPYPDDPTWEGLTMDSPTCIGRDDYTAAWLVSRRTAQSLLEAYAQDRPNPPELADGAPADARVIIRIRDDLARVTCVDQSDFVVSDRFIGIGAL